MAGSIMATTTNYSWSTPDNTAYVKDGASAIRTLGSAVDTTLYTALGGTYPGLRLIKKQTIGTGVSSVTVTNAFSATYQNYKIIVVGGSGSATSNLILTLDGATTGYYESLIFATYAGGGATNAPVNNGSSWAYAGDGNSNCLTMNVDILEPFAAEITRLNGSYVTAASAGHFSGYQSTASSYSAFSITPTSGTLTGGTIYVYGYGIS
jgi:hypothetical protein